MKVNNKNVKWWRRYTWVWLLALASLGINLTIAQFQTMPGYMDADYYFVNAQRIFLGHGWTEEFLWNYLDMPEGIPHPAFLYWMPLASMIGAVGMRLTGIESFSSARIGFLVIAVTIPLLTAWLAQKITRKKKTALLAGVMALFPGYYLPYLTITETFGIYMVLGGSYFLFAGKLFDLLNSTTNTNSKRFGLVLYTLVWGSIGGLMHLARAEGILWFLIGLGSLVYMIFSCSLKTEPHSTRSRYQSRFEAEWLLISYIAGYILIMHQWLLRNHALYGSIFPDGSARTLWLVDYDDLFMFPSSNLTPIRWWELGIMNLIEARWWSFWQNFKTTIAVQGMILLLPLSFLGIWNKRHNIQTKLGVVCWLGVWVLMTVVYPFQGGRGGYFHSIAALQPLFWTWASTGFDSFISWGIERRGWVYRRSWRTFSITLVGMIIAITSFVVWQKISHSDLEGPGGGSIYEVYEEIDQAIRNMGESPNAIVMVNNPPGFTAVTGRPAIVIPDGDLEMVLTAAGYYSARFLILDKNYPMGLKDIYTNRDLSPGLRYLGAYDNVLVFRFENTK